MHYFAQLVWPKLQISLPVFMRLFLMACPTFGVTLAGLCKVTPASDNSRAATSPPYNYSAVLKWGFTEVKHVADLCVNLYLLIFPILQCFLEGRISKQLFLHFKERECRPALHNQVGNSFFFCQRGRNSFVAPPDVIIKTPVIDSKGGVEIRGGLLEQ